MRQVDIDLDDGVVETRFYNKRNQLVDIRKKYPPMMVNRKYLNPSSHGAAGDGD